MVHSDLTEAPKHDAKNIVFFIQKACIKNEIYQHNSLYYNLINIFCRPYLIPIIYLWYQDFI